MNNPVFYHPGGKIYEDEPEEEEAGWYFWDEVWTYYTGPFDTEAEAQESCSEYAKTL